MYKHPEFPSYEEQIKVRDNMLEKNKELTFIGAHLASLEWSVDRISEFLNRFPNACVDTSARMSALEYQSQNDRESVRNFFIRFHERILYGTDLMQEDDSNAETFKNEAHRQWISDWRFLCTDEVFNVPDFKGNIKGLKLPCTVIDNIYRNNAQRVFSIV